MLCRADHVSVRYVKGTFGKGWVNLHVGKRDVYRIAKLDKSEFATLQVTQDQHPVFVGRIGRRSYWQFQRRFYCSDDSIDAASVHAVLVTRERRQQEQIERAQQIMAMDRGRSGSRARRGIPDDGRQLVWTRDQGRCQNCESTVEVQFDHIIPVALGGDDSPENLQILCGPCTRRKHASMTPR